MSYRDIQNEVSINRVWEHIEHITENIPSRLAGSENSRQMAEYARDQLNAYGISSQLHEFKGLVSFPEKGSLTFLSPESREVEANTLGHSATVSDLEGEVVYVGSGAESDYQGKDVRGKITLSELSYFPARHEKALIAWRQGSIAQIMMNWGDETNPAVPFGSMKSAWGNPTPEALRDEIADLPCIGIARPDGLRLKKLAEQGTVRVRLSANADNSYKDLTMTTGEFGADTGRQFLLLGGHMDSWPGPQATDNAAGSACILELSRVFHDHQSELRRGLMSGFWMAHETGTMVGSARLADIYWDRLRQSCVAYMQIDQPGMVETSTWHLHSTDDAQNYMLGAAEDIVGDMPKHWSRMRRTGDTSFFGVGIPNISGIMSFSDEEIKRTALANLGWWHHSLHNSIDKLDKDHLALHLKLYSRWLWDLLTMPILPFEYQPVAQRITERLEKLSYISVQDIDIRSTLEAARQFEEFARRFDQVSKQTRELATQNPANISDEQAHILNDVMIRLSRQLVPIVTTVSGSYGQDRYGHSWQADTVPSLRPYEILDNFDPVSTEFQTNWVSAVRARNRLMDTVTDLNGFIAEKMQLLRNVV